MVSVSPDYEVPPKNRAINYLLYYDCFCSVDENLHIHRIAIIKPNITIVLGSFESGKALESSSPESQINTRLLRPGYYHVCSKQWHGNSLCFNMMLLQLCFPDISSNGSTSSILGGFQQFCLLHYKLSLLILSVSVFQKTQNFPLTYLLNLFPSIGSNSSLVLPGTAANILHSNS